MATNGLSGITGSQLPGLLLRLIKHCTSGFATLLALLLITLILLIATESGTRWIIQSVLSSVEQVSVEHINGKLISKLSLKQLQYHDTNNFSVTVAELELQWLATELFQGHLHIHTLQLNNIKIKGQPNADKNSNNEIPLIPLTLSIDHLLITQFNWDHGESNTEVQQLAMHAKLANNTLSLSELVLTQPPLKITANSKIKLQADWPLSADLNWSYVLNETPVDGQLKVTGNMERFELHSSINGGGESSQEGFIKLSSERPEFNLHGQWKKLQWPLHGNPKMSSKSGEFHIQGTTQQYQLQLNAKLNTPDHTDFSINFAGNGNQNRFNIAHMQLIPPQGEIDLSGQLSWTETIAFNLLLNTQQLNLTNFVSDIPGKLDFKLHSKGTIADNKINAELDIKHFSGIIHDQPLNAQGKIKLAGQQLDIQTLKVSAGSNQLQVNGSVSQHQANLDMVIKAPSLHSAWPTLNGSLNGNVFIKGSLQNPIIKSKLQGQDVHYKTMKIGQLSLNADYSHTSKQQSKIDLIAQNIHYDEHKIEHISLDGHGNQDNHDIQLKLHSALIDLDIKTHGRWNNKKWLGQITKLDIEHPQFKQWQLQSPADIVLSQSNQNYLIDLNKSCLIQDDAQLCLSTQSLPNKQLDGRLSLVNLPLALGNYWLPDEITLNGTVSAQAQLSSIIKQLTAKLSITIADGMAVIKGEDGVSHDIPFQDSTIKLKYQYDQLNSLIQLGLGELDYIRAEVNIDHLASTQQLSGTVQGNIKNMKLIDSLLPEITQLRGIFVVDAELGGNIEQPVINGSALWKKGSLTLPILGSSFNNINLQISSINDTPDRLLLKADMESGQGNLSGQGYLDLLPAYNYPLQMTINGENFQISRLPEAEIAITPTLSIDTRNNIRKIEGLIKIDSAKIKFNTLPDGAITPSEDEVIISTERTKPKHTNPAILDTDITIQFGDETHFTGFGIKTRLSGQLKYLIQQKKHSMHGRAIMQDASYTTYGQDLSIRKGEFIFNGPTDNPWLNVEAIRKATTDDVTAVLSVTGQLKAPETKIYTEPGLSESEAISYLITGSSSKKVGGMNSDTAVNAALNYGVGQLSDSSKQLGIDTIEYKASEQMEDSTVNLGKYLNPDLYVGVGIGLFADKYEAILKYSLTNNFSIHARTGETGRVDLKYHLKTD